MHCFADRTMLPHLKEIWKECFGDEDSYINFFFLHQLESYSVKSEEIYMESKKVYENQLVYMDDDFPVSMLTMIPGLLAMPEGNKKIYYIYGVATKKVYRGRGYAAALLEQAFDIAQKDQAALVLVPASESLYTYYQRLGFKTAFYEKRLTLRLPEKVKTNKRIWNIREIDADIYHAMRKQQFAQLGNVIWNEPQLLYAYRENQFLGGNSYCIESEHKEYLLMCYAYQSCLYVRETSLPDRLIEMVIYTIMEQCKCITATVRRPVFCGSLGKTSANGMILPDLLCGKDKNRYLGLTLD